MTASEQMTEPEANETVIVKGAARGAIARKDPRNATGVAAEVSVVDLAKDPAIVLVTKSERKNEGLVKILEGLVLLQKTKNKFPNFPLSHQYRYRLMFHHRHYHRPHLPPSRRKNSL